MSFSWKLAPAFLLMAETFEPARVERGSVADVPYGARAAGVAIVDVNVDEKGAVTGVLTVQDLPPFTDVLKRSVQDWKFQPAREDGRAVATRVLVAGLFRPALLFFPAPDSLPLPAPDPDASIPIPKSVAVPPYPPNAQGSASALVELAVAADGSVSGARLIGEAPGFAEAALAAARAWTFRSASRRGRNVPARAYLIFVFRQPLIS